MTTSREQATILLTMNAKAYCNMSLFFIFSYILESELRAHGFRHMNYLLVWARCGLFCKGYSYGIMYPWQLLPHTIRKVCVFTTLVTNDSDSNIHQLLLKMFRPSEQRNPIPDFPSPPLICTVFLYTSILHASSLMLSLKLSHNIHFFELSSPC